MDRILMEVQQNSAESSLSGVMGWYSEKTQASTEHLDKEWERGIKRVIEELELDVSVIIRVSSACTVKVFRKNYW